MTAAVPGLRTVVIIPARWGSSRYPGKPLVELAGRPMIEHVVERCCMATSVEHVIVATDHDRIARAAELAGAEAVLTGEAASGSDRVAMVARERPEFDVVLNVQGDEPTLDPRVLDALLEPLARDATVEVTTPVRRFSADENPDDPNRVKAVLATNGRALYFSRARVPHGAAVGDLWLHMGLYGFRRDVLLRFATWPPTPLETVERLEQLRLLEHGVHVLAVPTTWRGLAVDTPADVAAVERHLQTGIL